MYFGWIVRITIVSLCGLCIAVGVQLWSFWYFNQSTTITFLAVGQGDAILIQSGHQQVLIDGGREGKVLLTALGEVMPFYDRTIDIVIATHPDADHIGGLPLLLNRYRVGQFVDTDFTQFTEGKRTDDQLLLQQALEIHHIPRAIPGRAGVSMTFQQGGSLSLLYPQVLPLDPLLESNEGSIVARFTFGTTDFLLTGDLPHEEDFLGDIEPVEVLKAAHHGSASSTSDVWLDMVQPKEVILSVGENNYGHPAEAVLDRLTERGISALRTDIEGPITYRCQKEAGRCMREKSL